MCLIAFAYRCHPGFPLVLAANRDEFLDRPTEPLGRFGPGLLAGRDLRGGGTWLGMSVSGRLAAITNYRDPQRVVASGPSRGEIIPAFLDSGQSAATFLERFMPTGGRYSGFNLILGDGGALYHYSNVSGRATRIEPGLYGLSNHLLDTPWPKVERVKQRFGATLAASAALDRQSLFELLTDRSQPDDARLPDTGVGLLWERRLAPIFISSPGYGTRSSSLLMVADDGAVEFGERSYRHGDGQVVVADERWFGLAPAAAVSDWQRLNLRAW